MIPTSELSALLYNEGASLVGFGDISALKHQGYTSCVALAVKIPAWVVAGISGGPTREYFEQYHALNSKLNALAELAAGYLTQRGCTACTSACPGRAVHGNLWDVSTPREELVDVEACRKAARALALERIGEHITLCGKCIEVCPYTRAYLKKEDAL